MTCDKSLLHLLMALCLLAIEAQALTELTADEGSLGSPPTQYSQVATVHLIRVRLGRIAVINFTSFDLDSADRDMVTIRDGTESPVSYVYSRGNDGIVRLREDRLPRRGDKHEGTAVNVPAQFHAFNRKVFVTYYTKNSREKAGFRAEYKTYPGCQVSDLRVRDDAPRCDSNPIATRCSHTIQCQAEDYAQYGDAVCSGGIWKDNTKCLPDGNLVEQCQFHDNGTISDCPFDEDELTTYFAETDDAGVFESNRSTANFARSARIGRRRCGKRVCGRATCDKLFGKRHSMRHRACTYCKIRLCKRWGRNSFD